ncbi:DUF3592 domain-containing protein [Nocardiopsis coralliicola]
MICSDRPIRAQGLTATARVVDFEWVSIGRGTHYFPTVEFHTHDGRSVREQSTVSSSPKLLPVGHAVQVHYLPREPERFFIEGHSSAHMAAVLGAFAVLFLSIGGTAVARALL